MIIPTVKRVSKLGQESMDLLTYSFLEKREIYLFDEITDDVAAIVIAQLSYLDASGNDDIRMIINSPGGSVSAGLAIYDAMHRCKCHVATICTGMAASMGAFLLSSGSKGKRYATPYSEIMIHQPLGGMSGQASDIEIVSRHICKTKERLNRILAANSGQTVEKIAADCDRNYFLDAVDAQKYGIVDIILDSNFA